MFSWLHLKFDDIQKWYVGGYLEMRWMSYFIGLYHLMHGFFLFITNIEHRLIICNRRKQKWSCSRTVFSTDFQLTNTPGEHDGVPWLGVCSLGIIVGCVSIHTSFFATYGFHISLSWLSCVLLVHFPASSHLFYVHILSTMVVLSIFNLIYSSLQPAYYRQKK